MNKKFLMLALAGLMLTNAQTNAAVPSAINAGGQMNRLNEYIEQERAARKIEEDRAKKAAKVEGADTAKASAPEAAEVKLLLNKLVTDPSSVLTAEEISSITKDYEGKEVTVKDLYKAVERINALYAEKGFITCKAFLLQQTIENGVVKVTLIEGKTGTVEVNGNKWTKTNYIKKRIASVKEEVVNINDLNQDMLRFNATNDVQLRIMMQAGKEPGTTDYVITAYEPKQYNWNVFSDNAGNENNGEVRGGLFFSAKSLAGSRDALMLGTVMSKGSKAVTTSYNHSLGRSGTKLNLGYNTNSVKTVKGAYKNMLKGHSNSVNIGVTQPWVVNEKTRSEAIIELNHQKSSTDFLRDGWSAPIVRDTINDVFVGFAMTNYGDSHVFYQKHTIAVGKIDSAVNDKDDKTFALFKANGFYQKAYKNGQSINVRGELQWTNKDYLPSARQFYLGGMYSVRGYEENFRGGDKGVVLSAEYAVPLNDKKNVSAFTFLDYGHLYGRDSESYEANKWLMSTGFGIKANITKNIYANLTMGIPLKKHLNDGHDEPSSVKLHFTLNGQF